MFLVAATLVLATAGVFAAKSKLAGQGLYVVYGASYISLATPNLGAGLQLSSNGAQVTATDHAGQPYAVVYGNGISYVPVYSSTTTPW